MKLEFLPLKPLISVIIKPYGKKEELKPVLCKDCKEYLLVVKDESVNVERISTSLELAMEEPFTIDRVRNELLQFYALQVHENVKMGANQRQQIRQVARILHTTCCLKYKRSINKDLNLDSLETTLYSLLRKIRNT